jgi:hypothetical protein
VAVDVVSQEMVYCTRVYLRELHAVSVSNCNANNATAFVYFGVTTADVAAAAAECPRVRAQAAAALVNFLEPCPAEIAALYLDRVLAACRQQVCVYTAVHYSYY